MKNNTVSFCLKPVSTCCIKPKPLKICSYRNINKSQNEDFQSNGGTYFLAHFCTCVFYIEKQRKYYPCAIILIVVKELFSLL